MAFGFQKGKDEVGLIAYHNLKDEDSEDEPGPSEKKEKDTVAESRSSTPEIGEISDDEIKPNDIDDDFCGINPQRIVPPKMIGKLSGLARIKLLEKIVMIKPNEFPPSELPCYLQEQALLEATLRGRYGLAGDSPKTGAVLLYGQEEKMIKYVAFEVASKLNVTWISLSLEAVKVGKIYFAVALVKELFAVAAIHQPCIVLIHDLALLNEEEFYLRDIKRQLNKQIDRARADKKQIVVFAVTTTPWRLNQKMMIRFREKFYIGADEHRQCCSSMMKFRNEYDMNYDPPAPGANLFTSSNVLRCFFPYLKWQSME